MTDKLKILLLDDDPDDIFLACDSLDQIEGQNYEVLSALTVKQAFELVAHHTFDAILCDYHMGSVSGVDFIREVRSLGHATPIILLTGLSGGTVDEAALKAGATDYLCKVDMSPAVLDRAIRYAVANTSRQALLSSVLSNVGAGVCVVDRDGKPEIWNRLFADFAKSSDCQGTESECVVRFAELASTREKTLRNDNQIFEKKISVLADQRRVITIHDVTAHVTALRERELERQKTSYLAKHCSLTGLANRLGFLERVQSMIDSGQRFQLINLDLDRFKEVNDLFGHQIGDELLVKVARRIRDCSSEREYVTRMGGDEFVVLQPLSRGDKNCTRLTDQFAKAMAVSFDLSGHVVNSRFSMGVATFPDNGLSVEELLSNADIAMYRSKRNPDADVIFYDRELDAAIRKRRLLSIDLKQAIANRQIDVHFQPLADVKTQRITGFEALARWTHPDHGNVPPQTFVELAEQNGLIEALGQAVLLKACQTATSWPLPVNLAVNVSGVQIRHTDFVRTVREALFESGLPAARLELEVTESVLLDDFDLALHVLRGLKNLGVTLAMDDFGTGHSSLSSLIAFPFDKLKIDRTFVTQASKQEKLADVVRTCVGLAHNLNLKVVAEGVEDEDDVGFLKELGCEQMQGFYLGKPMPSKDAVALLEEGDGMIIVPKTEVFARTA